MSFGIALWTADASQCCAANLQLSSKPGSDKLLGQVVNVGGMLQQLAEDVMQEGPVVAAASAISQLQQCLQLEACTPHHGSCHHARAGSCHHVRAGSRHHVRAGSCHHVKAGDSMHT